MISKLHLKNFKAFEFLDIELRPITILLGPNNSGKSSILSVLRLLTQTVESSDSTIPLLLNGIMGDFGTYKDIVYSNNTKRNMELGLSIPLKSLRGKEENLFNDINIDNEISIKLVYKYRSRVRDIILNEFLMRLKNDILLSTSFSEDSEKQIINKIFNKDVPASIKSNLSTYLRMENFLIRDIFTAAFKKETVTSEFIKSNELDRKLINIMLDSRGLIRYFGRIEYIGAMRLPPLRTYLFSGEKRNRIGSSGEDMTSILSNDSGRSGSKSLNLLDLTSTWLSRAGIASNVKIHPISNRHYEIQIQHPITREYQNYADVGYGNSQILPVLIAGYSTKPNSTFMVEEPEIHLHPKAQAELGDFFLDLYDRGVQSLVETHSEHLILRLQQHVASKRISKEHIAIYYIHGQENSKVAQQLRLDDEGRFLDNPPNGFFPERLEEAKNLAKIRALLRADEEA